MVVQAVLLHAVASVAFVVCYLVEYLLDSVCAAVARSGSLVPLVLEFPVLASALWLLPDAQVQDESLVVLPVLLVTVLMRLAPMSALASARLDVYGVVPVVLECPGNQEDIEILQSQGVVPLTTASTAQSVSP